MKEQIHLLETFKIQQSNPINDHKSKTSITGIFSRITWNPISNHSLATYTLPVAENDPGWKLLS